MGSQVRERKPRKIKKASKVTISGSVKSNHIRKSVESSDFGNAVARSRGPEMKERRFRVEEKRSK